MRAWIGMTGGMDKYCISPRVGDKELPRVGHQLVSCSLLNSYVLMFLLFSNNVLVNFPSLDTVYAI